MSSLWFKEFFYTVLCFNLFVDLQVAVIKTYYIEDVTLGSSCIKFGNHERIPVCWEVRLFLGLSVCLCLLLLTRFLATQVWSKVSWGGFQSSIGFTQGVKLRLEGAEHCKLLAMGEIGHKAKERCEDFKCKGRLKCLDTETWKAFYCLKTLMPKFPLFPHSGNSISSLLLPLLLWNCCLWSGPRTCLHQFP